jgi:predicted permease
MKLPRVFGRKRDESDLSDEIRFHLAEEARMRVDRGEPESAARAAAARDFGNTTLVSEFTREMWGWTAMETFVQDLGYGIRQLRRSPVFTLVAVLTLALGIGANTAIFSIVNSFLLRPLPVPAAEQISVLAFRQKEGPLQTQFSYPDLQDIREQSNGVFSDLAGYQIGLGGLTDGNRSSRMWINYVTGNYFSMLGVQPALGRLIEPGEGKVPGADAVLVLSYRYWKSQFNGDAGVVGRKVSVNGRPFTVIGVAAEGFHGLFSILDTQAFLPLGMAVMEVNVGDFMGDRANRNLYAYGRLKPGVPIQQARAEVAVIAQRLARHYPQSDEGISIQVFPERRARPEPTADQSLVTIAVLFMLLAGFVLLLACINVSNIMLVRASARQREMAIRTALGAGRVRLVRQLLTESVLLAIFGGAAGVLLGVWGASALGSMNLGTSLPIFLDFHFDWTVFWFALGIALCAGTLMGMIPAMRAARGGVASVLRAGGRSVSAGRHDVRSALVVVQVAGSLVLLIAAALFTSSLQKAGQVKLGFDPDHLVNVTFDANQGGYSEAQGRQLAVTVLNRVRGLPGVESAAIAFSVPMGYYSTFGRLHIPGFDPLPGQPQPVTGFNLVTPGYFETMRIPLRSGRVILPTDTQKSQGVAVINHSMAETYWPGQEPLGRHFQITDDSTHPDVQVVGVVADSRTSRLTGPMKPYFYLPLEQYYSSMQTLQVRTSRAPEGALLEIEQVLRALTPGMPLSAGQSMHDGLRTFNGLLQFEIGATMAAVLGSLGLILAVVGLYGVVSYAAEQRTNEIGIRMALGARPIEILRMIVRQGTFLVGGGLILGTLAAIALARMLAPFLLGVKATDPWIFGAAIFLLAAVGLAACYLPARRATHIDPVTALRVE